MDKDTLTVKDNAPNESNSRNSLRPAMEAK